MLTIRAENQACQTCVERGSVIDKSLAQLLNVSSAFSICGTLLVNTALESDHALLIVHTRAELQAALHGMSGDFLQYLIPPNV
jgi:hypothetical protein